MDSILLTKLVISFCLLSLACAILLSALFLLSLILTGVPFVPTPAEVMEKMLELAEIKKGEKVYDLGCGDGRLLIEANKKYGARVSGIEMSPLAYALARFRVWISGADVNVLWGDFLKCDLSDADVVFCYLYPRQMKRLQARLNDLKQTCRIVSHQFEIPGRVPLVRVNVEGKSYVATVFKYVI